jgi:poly(3-hydroxybutyrate) depolymerase
VPRQKRAKISKETVLSHERNRTYYLFVPKSLKAPAPLVLVLHGSGRDGLSLVEKWKELAEKEGIIIAGPNSSDPANWSAPNDGPDLLYDLVEDLKQKLLINARRVYLFGHSGGASFALQMCLFESEYFAATAVHAGALPEKAYAIADKAAKRKIPIAIFSGTDDRSVPINMVRATGAELKKRGFPIEVTEMPHHDHWYYDLASRINANAWSFLSSYELSADPQFARIQFR